MTIKTIGEVCSFERGLTYSKDNEVSTSSLGVLRSNNIDVTSNKLNFDEIKYLNDEIEIPNTKKVKRNSILMCISNGSKSHLGKVAIIENDIDFAFGGFMGLLTPNKQIIFPKYLYYSLTTPCYKLFIKNLSDGANINNLKFNELKEFSIPVPPIEEQERIVSLLDSAFSKIESLKKNAENSLENAKSLFQSALKKELEPKEGWEIKTIGEVCSIINGGTPSTSVVNYWNGNIQWITPKDMSGLTSKHIKKTERTISQEGVAHSSAKILPPQSVILSSRAPIGYVAINTVPMATNQGCKGIVTTNEIKSEFLYYFLIKSYDLLNNLGTGATFKELSGSKLASISIPVPPIEEQERIVKKLDSLKEKCDVLEKNLEKTIALCENLKQALLRQAFNGEL